MKTRVKVVEKKFHTSNKVTVCIIRYDLQLFKHPAYDVLSYKSIVKYDKIFTVKAIAKCEEGDVFNPILGRRIAESKAKSKAFEYAAKVYKNLAEDLLNTSALLMTSFDACKCAVQIEDDHIYELVDNV